MYINPVDRSSIAVDKYGGVVLAWSRFDNSIKQTFAFAIQYGFWSWSEVPSESLLV